LFSEYGYCIYSGVAAVLDGVRKKKKKIHITLSEVYNDDNII
jgi:hypothetical protein